jgi:hypothetical protein
MKRLIKLNAYVCELAQQAGEKIMGFYEEGAGWHDGMGHGGGAMYY